MEKRGVVAACYGHAGAVSALWGTTLPATDARLDLGPGRLGSILMVMAAGALLAMPVAGWLANRFTGRRLLRLAAPAASVVLVGPALAPSVGLLGTSAFVLGVLLGLMNVALSLQAVAVEREAGRPIMATMHGTWTLGAVAVGGLVFLGLRSGVDSQVLMTAGVVPLTLFALAAGRNLTEPHPAGADAPPALAAARPAVQDTRPAVQSVPSPAVSLRVVIALGAIGAAAFIAEGAVTDWAGVHATRVLDADPAIAALGYTFFFVAMTIIRFVGDAVRARLGAARTIRLAGSTATAGYLLVLLAGVLPGSATTRVGCAIAGWALAGAGIAVVWPVVTSALGTATAAAEGGAGRLAAVTTISYGAGLVGPAVIGYAASKATLPIALLIPATLAVVVAIAAPPILRLLDAPGNQLPRSLDLPCGRRTAAGSPAPPAVSPPGPGRRSADGRPAVRRPASARRAWLHSIAKGDRDDRQQSLFTIDLRHLASFS